MEINGIEFATNVFDDATMRERLPEETYKMLRRTIAKGERLNLDVAQVVAGCMKEWAIEKGATHFCHWFMPMTGCTSEKHDAFLDINASGVAIMDFSGKNLIQGEPDASSFPSGGLRATFEARGYTAWDCTSPAFVKEGSLYIPTAFCSYNGDALDKKTPLLRSMDALNTAGVRFSAMLGMREVSRVLPMVGAEQEYFIIDRQLYLKRADLMMTGRTLLGRLPAKGQELNDHYFGSLKPRIAAYMAELDRELWKLGVTAKTKHNENAPCQHELAPIFEIANIATDHNYLTMDVMKKVAEKHGLVCLLHEKPFEGVNGSGKHNNWSMATDTGFNFLDPGKDPKSNLPFLLTLAAVVRAVDESAELLRMSVANGGNDHRLGAHEAPPGIVSIYLGEGITSLVEDVKTGESSAKAKKSIRHGVKILPEFVIDNSDRNRTSPFAFTGNKFEFRMVGSSASVAGPNTVINAIVADSLNRICDNLEQSKDLQTDAYELVKKIFVKHSRIVFNGNNYSDEWVDAAAVRGLSNIKDNVGAVKVLKDEAKCAVLLRTNVYTKQELNSRFEILMDNYCKSVNIEALTLLDMLQQSVLPSCLMHETNLLETFGLIRDASDDLTLDTAFIKKDVEELHTNVVSLRGAMRLLSDAVRAAQGVSDQGLRGEAFRDNVIPAMRKARSIADYLEGIVDADLWRMPTYYDLFYKV